ncbi:hypothetical protein EO087_01285 [Dyella sp. M7H15-1]|uniref:XAC0095 family protein n=1 Tax=Dyella sp. M7H15-1 TaxID=2501295 RepID=UPI0010051541|nr:hypothetical protein [Dyella sp. M7H15-1]QAU22783.1 hypothetical protein EO087_01285 [Dyella sp. M7H15-1]
MTGKPFVPRGTSLPAHYALPAGAFQDLCVVRDELRLFAAVTARRATHDPEVLICRNTLAHCFDHLAQRVDDIVRVLNGDPEDHVAGAHAEQDQRKN